MGRIYPRSIIFVDSQIKKDSKLVNWVKLWPIIFDETNPLYFNSVEREKIWELIATNLDSTAQICEERWRLLVDAYEKYKNGYLTMHEVLYDQLEECMNTVYSDIKQNTQEIHIHKSSTISEIKEEVQSFSLISQQYGPFFPGSSKREYGIKKKTMVPPLSEIGLNFTETSMDYCFSGINEARHTSIVHKMQNTHTLTDIENLEPAASLESPIVDISQEQHSCLFFDNSERSI